MKFQVYYVAKLVVGCNVGEHVIDLLDGCQNIDSFW